MKNVRVISMKNVGDLIFMKNARFIFMKINQLHLKKIDRF